MILRRTDMVVGLFFDLYAPEQNPAVRPWCKSLSVLECPISRPLIFFQFCSWKHSCQRNCDLQSTARPARLLRRGEGFCFVKPLQYRHPIACYHNIIASVYSLIHFVCELTRRFVLLSGLIVNRLKRRAAECKLSKLRRISYSRKQNGRWTNVDQFW